MSNFTLEYQDPFADNLEIKTVFREHEVFEKFNSIDWYANNLAIYRYHFPLEGDSEIKEPIHEYYYLAIEYKDFEKLKHQLNIVPNYKSNESYTKEDLLFSIEYRRPKLVPSSRLARFFGKATEKIEPEYISHLKDISAQETLSIIKDFMQKNIQSLNSKLTIKGYLY